MASLWGQLYKWCGKFSTSTCHGHRNLGKGDLPHQIRPASQQAQHRAPSCVPHLWLLRGLKPSSPLHTAGKGWRIRLGIKGDIFEVEPDLLRAASPVLWATFVPGKDMAVHNWRLPVPRATRHCPSQGWHLANGFKDQAVPPQQSSHRSEIRCDPKKCRLKGRGLRQLTDYRRINVTGLPSLPPGDSASRNTEMRRAGRGSTA